MSARGKSEDKRNKDANILEFVAKLKAGEIQGKLLPRETRIACVAQMVVEGGVGPMDLADIFGVDPRTIRRDLEWLREANVIRLDALRREEIRQAVHERLMGSMLAIEDLESRMAKTLSDHLKCIQTSWRIMKEAFAILKLLRDEDRQDETPGSAVPI